MSNRKRLMYCLIVGVVLGLCLSVYNRCTGKAKVVKVERDTIVVYDTVPYRLPVPKDSVVTKYVTRFMPVVRTDTVTHYEFFTEHDTVAVAVPIMSKHYGSDTFDAWVSGFEPSLDSIRVYQRTAYVTEIRTISKPPNKWELDVVGGIDYAFKTQQYRPYAGGELLYKPNRLQVGIQGGIVKGEKVEPFVGGKVKVRIL